MSQHYLRAIRLRLEQLYEEHPNDPTLREHISDEVDWIDATIEQSAEPITHRWRSRGTQTWIYDPEPLWLAEHKFEIEWEPVYGAPRPAAVAATPASLTDETIDAYLKSTGEWCEPHEAERESGVAVECDISQDDADWINADTRAALRRTYEGLAALIFSPDTRPMRGGT